MISVIIPSYNSESTIIPVLTALNNQTYRDAYEIILVDSSDDRTPQLVTEQFPEVRFHHFDVKTDPGTARNLGVQMSKGNPILFIDSDCIAARDWIERMAEAHQKGKYMAIGGAVLNGNDPNNQVAWAGYMAEFREYLPEYPKGIVPHIPTCNISYKRKLFDKIEPFHPRYYPQEDLEFNYRLRQSGYEILFDPKIKIRHNHRTKLKAFYGHQHRVGQITSRMLKILPLEGSMLARNRWLSVLSLPALPLVKFARTMFIFVKKQPRTLLRNPIAVIIFFTGLFPWMVGFVQGAFAKPE